MGNNKLLAVITKTPANCIQYGEQWHIHINVSIQ